MQHISTEITEKVMDWELVEGSVITSAQSRACIKTFIDDAGKESTQEVMIPTIPSNAHIYTDFRTTAGYRKSIAPPTDPKEFAAELSAGK